MSKPTAEDRDRARHSHMLSGLPDRLAERVLRKAEAVTLERDAVLFEQGEPANSFYFVLDGWVKLCQETPSGAETVIAALTGGESFAEPPAITGAAYPVTAEAATDARLLRIPVAGLLDEMRQDPELSFAVIASCLRFLQKLVTRVHISQSRTASQRLAFFLSDLVGDRAAAGSCEVRLPHRKSLLAARLGMSPESLSRAFASLRRFGVRMAGGLALIDDIESLQRHAEGDCR